jgi:hypothetical protein
VSPESRILAIALIVIAAICIAVLLGTDEDAEDERCPSCGGDAGDNWFDRSLCACGSMHTCCAKCGHALDGCPYEKAVA